MCSSCLYTSNHTVLSPPQFSPYLRAWIRTNEVRISGWYFHSNYTTGWPDSPWYVYVCVAFHGTVQQGCGRWQLSGGFVQLNLPFVRADSCRIFPLPDPAAVLDKKPFVRLHRVVWRQISGDLKANVIKLIFAVHPSFNYNDGNWQLF